MNFYKQHRCIQFRGQRLPAYLKTIFRARGQVDALNLDGAIDTGTYSELLMALLQCCGGFGSTTDISGINTRAIQRIQPIEEKTFLENVSCEAFPLSWVPSRLSQIHVLVLTSILYCDSAPVKISTPS